MGDNKMTNPLFLHDLKHKNTPFPFALTSSKAFSKNFLHHVAGDNIQSPYYAGTSDLLHTKQLPYSSQYPEDCSDIRQLDFLDKLEFHTHDHYQISLCTKGCCNYIINNHLLSIHEGDILCINHYIPHSWYSSEESSFFHLGYYSNSLNLNTFCARFAPYIDLLYSQLHPCLLLAADTSTNSMVCSILQDIKGIHEKRLLGYDALIHNRIIDLSICLVIEFIAKNADCFDEYNSSASIQKAVTFMNDNYQESINVTTVAKHVGMNSDYFSHFFKHKMGISCKKYLNLKRVEHAAILLANKDLDITQIAFDCGFLSLSTFYKCFADSYHMSPRQFRQSGSSLSLYDTLHKMDKL